MPNGNGNTAPNGGRLDVATVLAVMANEPTQDVAVARSVRVYGVCL